jgi:polar amino acid transport system ATP-binding protein
MSEAMGNPLLDVRGVWKSFDETPVLRGIDLSVSAHTVNVLIGASGSGKSTLLRCINALESIDAGTIFLDGDLEVSALDAKLNTVRRRIGIVFQSFNLFPHMSVRDNVTLAPMRVLGKKRADAKSEAEALLEQFGLADKADDFPDRLSGGQAQRVAIVRALAMQPELLLFDEITSSLDPLLVGEVLDAVRTLKERGFTIIMATHEIGFARQVADRVCFLHNGVVHEQGTAAEVLDAPQDPVTRQFLARTLH